MRAPRFLLVPAVAAALILGGPLPAHAEEPPVTPASTAASTPAPQPDIALGDGAIPAGKTGEQVEVSFPIINRGTGAAVNVLVSPKMSTDAAHFPFEIARTDYTVAASNLAPGKQAEVKLGTFTLRPGLASGYYTMPLAIQYNDGVKTNVTEKTIFIHVDGVPQPEPNTPDPITIVQPPNVEVIVQPGESSGAGGGGGIEIPSNGGVSGAGSTGAAATGGSTPRVMLTSFATNPAEVEAGQGFQLSFGLSNMSQRVGVGNIKVTVVAPEASFLPIGGASSVFIDAIGINQTVTRGLEFRALPTLEERPYQLTLRIDYEDSANFQALTAEENIAVVVRQKQRAETSAIQALPSSIAVDEDANISFTVQNKGKNRLYNTRVYVKEGQPVSATEVFVGNVEPGASGTVDLMVHGDKETAGPVKIEVSFEDAAGVATTLEREVKLEVTHEVAQPTQEPTKPAGGLGLGMLPIMVGLLVIIAAIVAIYLVQQRRKARKEQELAASLDSLDAEPIVPVDPQ